VAVVPAPAAPEAAPTYATWMAGIHTTPTGAVVAMAPAPTPAPAPAAMASDVLAWLSLKAMALAWPETVLAFGIAKPGQSRQCQLALA
jgi:hypothetical protein